MLAQFTGMVPRVGIITEVERRDIKLLFRRRV
jgi:hypothetical protein